MKSKLEEAREKLQKASEVLVASAAKPPCPGCGTKGWTHPGTCPEMIRLKAAGEPIATVYRHREPENN